MKGLGSGNRSRVVPGVEVSPASAGEIARKIIPWSTSELMDERRNWHVFRCLSKSSSENPMVLICVHDNSLFAMVLSGVSLKVSPNPQ